MSQWVKIQVGTQHGRGVGVFAEDKEDDQQPRRGLDDLLSALLFHHRPSQGAPLRENLFSYCPNPKPACD